MEIVIFTVFCVMLIACVVLNVSILIALSLGLLLFLIYGKKKGFTLRQLWIMCLDGIKTARNVIITMLIIGALTALWRASGCISTIVCYSSRLIKPSVFILLTFLLNSLVSTLTGTAFGTMATMGVICASIGASMNIPPFWIGGAVLGGSFLGDRCSPVSTSALLVSTITETDIYTNIRNMLRSALLPFLLTCAVYLAAGLTLKTNSSSMDVRGLFESEFVISIICLLPALVMLVLALFKVEVKTMMLISIAVSIPIALFVQHQSILQVLKTVITGFEAKSTEISGIINGGGIVSMVSVAAVVLIASCYSGIFQETGMLNFMLKIINRASSKTSSILIILITSIVVSVISCNQTLAIMLTEQLTSEIEKDKEKRALYLADTAVVIPPLIPWSIASSVPLATVGAPMISILVASYLYLLPIISVIKNRKRLS